ncbi:MAG: hypothetical protein V1708_05730 [Candidatus Micrarchaeota archaeon]
METVVRFSGVPEYVLDKLVSMGYFATKTEALRAGVLGLGKEYGVLGEAQKLEDEMASRKAQQVSGLVKAGKMKTVSLDEVLNRHGIKRSDLK